MAKIKSFEKFLESYSEDLNQVLSNDENNYIVMKGDDIIGGYEYLEDAFTNISELLEGDGTIDEDQKYEFEDLISEMVSSDIDGELVSQDEIDEILNEILDKFGIIEPYKIMNRMEVEETPIDNSFDDDDIDNDINVYDDYDYDEYPDTNQQESDLAKSDLDQELDEFLGESVTSEPFCIVGNHNGKMEEIDSFMSSEEADSYLDDYKKIYNEFEDMKVIHRDEMSNESNLIFVPENEEECDCEDGECNCGEKKDSIKSFKDFK